MNENIVQDGKATQFKPGQSGNPNGRPRLKPLTDEFKRRRDENNGALAKELIQVAIEQAKDGDFRFWKELIDRSDGKVIEKLDVTSENVNVDATPGLSNAQRDKLAEFEDGPE